MNIYKPIILLIFLFAGSETFAKLTDKDMDGVETSIDNCPNHANRFQADSDNDGTGDTCDKDTLNNKHIPLIYEAILLDPIAIEASKTGGLGSCKFQTPIIHKILVHKNTELDQYSIRSMKFGFTAEHIFRGDLRVTIESPQGTRIKVINDDGGGEFTGFDIYLDDSVEATKVIYNEVPDNPDLPFYDRSAVPNQPLSGFDGESPFGIWKIEICDAFDIEDDGMFIGASLVFREGMNLDNDSENNISDCAKLDPKRWQKTISYLDIDNDGYGSGKPIEKCIGLQAPSGYAINDDDNCPILANSDQHDTDNDGVGDACDTKMYKVVKRVEIAKPILLKIYGEHYDPPPASGRKFKDVQANDFHADWIEQLASLSSIFSEACVKNRYCPNSVLTKDQLAKILLKAKQLRNTLPDANSQNVNEKYTSIQKEKWTKQINTQMYSEACSVNNHCLNEVVTFEVFENILNRVFP